MRTFVLGLAGLAMVSTASAQSDPARIEFLPIPEKVPLIMFSPAPLAGTMLEPFEEPGVTSSVRPQSETGGDASAEAAPTVGVETSAGAQAAIPPVVGPGDPMPVPYNPQPAPAQPGTAAPAMSDPTSPEQAAAPVVEENPAAALPAPPGSTITVIVENVENDDGLVNVAVCDKALSREGCPFDTSVQATAGFVEAKFAGIPPGTYAVVGYHDENGNDEFDKFLGMPREPYALSSDAAETLVPTFSDAALEINEGDNVVIIRLKRFGGG